MAEMRGCDLVVDYLIKERAPYLFGYAGHGAVGCSTASTTARTSSSSCSRGSSRRPATWPTRTSARPGMIPVYTSTGPGPMLLTVAMGNAFYDSSAFIAITGQVATNQFDWGALQEEYRHHPADFPSDRQGDHRSAASRRTRSRTWRSSCRRRSSSPRQAGPGPCTSTSLRPLDPHGRRRDARAGGALAAAELAHARLARGRRQGAGDAAEGASGR